MKLAGFFLLLAGCIIILSAISLLAAAAVARDAFMLAGLAVQAVGLVLAFRSHLSFRETR